MREDEDEEQYSGKASWKNEGRVGGGVDCKSVRHKVLLPPPSSGRQLQKVFFSMI